MPKGTPHPRPVPFTANCPAGFANLVTFLPSCDTKREETLMETHPRLKGSNAHICMVHTPGKQPQGRFLRSGTCRRVADGRAWPTPLGGGWRARRGVALGLDLVSQPAHSRFPCVHNTLARGVPVPRCTSLCNCCCRTARRPYPRPGASSFIAEGTPNLRLYLPYHYPPVALPLL